MSSFTLIVSTGPTTTEAFTAYKFCLAALSLEHEIKAVFFYQDGCYNASQLVSPPSDENNLFENWQQLAKQHSVPLVNCATAAAKRGVVSAMDMDSYGVISANMGDRFTAGGLGELVVCSAQSDRVIQF